MIIGGLKIEPVGRWFYTLLAPEAMIRLVDQLPAGTINDPKRADFGVQYPQVGYPRRMARPLRVQFSGALYHVTARGSERKPLFRDQRERPAQVRKYVSQYLSADAQARSRAISNRRLSTRSRHHDFALS
jgi:hypothetical protein